MRKACWCLSSGHSQLKVSLSCWQPESREAWDGSVLVPQHPLVAAVLHSDRDRQPCGRARVLKRE